MRYDLLNPLTLKKDFFHFFHPGLTPAPKTSGVVKKIGDAFNEAMTVSLSQIDVAHPVKRTVLSKLAEGE